MPFHHSCSHLLKTAGLALMVALAVPAFASPEIARDMLEKNSNAAIAQLEELRIANDLSALTVLPIMQKEMSPLINFRKLTSQAAGKYWRKATDDEKMQLAEVFQLVLEKNYANVLSRFSGQQVDVADAKLQADGKIVVSVNVGGTAGSARIDYIFADEPPKIINIKVEGVGLLSTYRRQFGPILKKNGFAGLISRLEKLAAK